MVLDSSIAAENAVAELVVTVAERGLPGHDNIFREVQGDGDRVGDLAAIFFGENSSGHISSRGQRKIEGRHDPGDLVDHVFRAVAAGEFPEQSPVDELESIERAVRTSVQKSAPLDVLRGAIGRNGAHPLALAMRSVTAHPGFDVGDFADCAVFDQLLGVDQGTGTLMLQANLDHPVRGLGRGQAFVGFGDRPGHGLLRVEIFPRDKSIEEVASVNVQRTGHDDAIDVFHVEQAPVVVQSLYVRDLTLGLVAATAVHVSHDH